MILQTKSRSVLKTSFTTSERIMCREFIDKSHKVKFFPHRIKYGKEGTAAFATYIYKDMTPMCMFKKREIYELVLILDQSSSCGHIIQLSCDTASVPACAVVPLEMAEFHCLLWCERQRNAVWVCVCVLCNSKLLIGLFACMCAEALSRLKEGFLLYVWQSCGISQSDPKELIGFKRRQAGVCARVHGRVHVWTFA